MAIGALGALPAIGFLGDSIGMGAGLSIGLGLLSGLTTDLLGPNKFPGFHEYAHPGFEFGSYDVDFTAGLNGYLGGFQTGENGCPGNMTLYQVPWALPYSSWGVYPGGAYYGFGGQSGVNSSHVLLGYWNGWGCCCCSLESSGEVASKPSSEEHVDNTPLPT